MVIFIDTQWTAGGFIQMQALHWRAGANTTVLPVLLESFTAYQNQDIWNDQVAVFLKDEVHVTDYPRRMLAQVPRYMNGRLYGSDAVLSWQTLAKTG